MPKSHNQKSEIHSKWILKFGDMMASFAEQIANHKYKTVLIFTITLGLLGSGLPGFRINQSLDAFFNDTDQTYLEYQWLKYIFGSDEFLVIMYSPKDGNIFGNKSLQSVKNLEDRLNASRTDPSSPLKHITRIRSIISADYLSSDQENLFNKPFIGENIPQDSQSTLDIIEKAKSHPDYPGRLFSKDLSYGTILVSTDFGTKISEADNFESDTGQKKSSSAKMPEDQFDFSGNSSEIEGIISVNDTPKMDKASMEEYSAFMTAFRKVLSDESWTSNQDSMIAGNPWLMDFFNKVINKEMELYGTLSLFIMWMVLFIAFKTISAIVWPTILLLSSQIMTIGLIGWIGTEMTFVVQIIILLLFASSMATSIHILTSYKLHLAQKSPPIEALKKTYQQTALPIVLAAVTTAIGLISVVFVPINAIKYFGLYAFSGVLLTLLSNLFMWPALLSIWAPKLKKRQTTHNTILQRILFLQTSSISRHRYKIIFGFSLFAVIMGAGIPRIHIDTNMVEMIKPGYGVRESYQAIDKHFGGTASLEVLIDTGDQDGVKNPELLRAMDAFSETIKAEFPDIVSRVDSVVSLAKQSNQHMLSGQKKDYRIPETKSRLAQVLLSFESADPATRKLYVDHNWQVARITFMLKTRGVADYQRLTNTLNSQASRYFDKFSKDYASFNLIQAGSVPLMTQLVELISVSQIRSFGIALGVISLVILILFGSLKFGLMAMVPNVFPLIVIAGIIGWLGVPLDSDTLLVIPIAIGVAVDDTIHFMSHYKAEILSGQSPAEAVEQTILKVGTALTNTSVVLSLGFLMFIFSSNIPITNFGVLSAVAICSALLADLYLLPVLILIFKPFTTESKPLKKEKRRTLASDYS